MSAALHIADTRMYQAKHGRRAATIVAQTRDVLLRATAEHSPSLPDHMLEVGELARNVARRLGLDAEMAELTLRAGELHDVGKLAIPESILSKPTRLSDAEWTFVRQHTLIGERALNAAAALQPVARVVRSTHERFDGAGYPDGLTGEQIPLPSRIVFACDALDAMISSRPYAPGMSATDARGAAALCRQPVRPARDRRAPRRTRPPDDQTIFQPSSSIELRAGSRQLRVSVRVRK